MTTRSAISGGLSTPESTSSTPPASTPRVSPRPLSARRSRAGARSSSPPRSTARSARASTPAATSATGSSAPSRTACRLQTDVIDLYQVHRPEPGTDIDDTLGALSDLVHQGKVRYVGSSTFPPSQVVGAQWVARERGRAGFVPEQPPYSPLRRGIGNDPLPPCRAH